MINDFLADLLIIFTLMIMATVMVSTIQENRELKKRCIECGVGNYVVDTDGNIKFVIYNEKKEKLNETKNY